MSTTLDLAMELISRPSVTPNDAGCQDLLEERLAALGFHAEFLHFGEVRNLWARRGERLPLFVFAGHTDVVPTGDEADWSSPPFEPTLRSGRLYGRGAADMKGSLAAMVTACERFVATHPDHRGSLAFLITSDEEGPAVDGTARVMETLSQRGEQIDMCVVGEPSSDRRLGDTVRIGRRGSLNARLTIRGVQGHVAYPEKALNPIHAFAPALLELTSTTWDEGNDHFPRTSFQVSNIRAGTGATNVIPGALELDFNFRFSTELEPEQIQHRVEQILKRYDLDYAIRWQLSGRPFVTSRGPLLDAVATAIASVSPGDIDFSTGGGTSDGRFIAPTGAQVIELGPINATIHQIDECVGVDELDQLSLIYEQLLVELFAA